jgi:hypothetical protein
MSGAWGASWGSSWGSSWGYSAGAVVVETPSGAGGSTAGTGGGGFAKTWRDHWDSERKREKKRDFALERVRDSEEYIRLKRKLAMLQEHLLDAISYRQTDLVKAKIREVEDRMKSLEMSVLH